MQKEYTPIRRFYATVGFLTLICGTVYFFTWLHAAHQFLAANGY